MNTNAPSRVATTPKVLTFSLWLVQVLLAAAFAMAGIMKTTMPMAQLAQKLAWTGTVPPLLVRFIGGCELAGALGLIVPAILRIKPILTPLAAAGLLLVMALATAFHISRGQYGALPITVFFGLLAAFVAWGRLHPAPIQPR
jgi:hypothetical protein